MVLRLSVSEYALYFQKNVDLILRSYDLIFMMENTTIHQWHIEGGQTGDIKRTDSGYLDDRQVALGGDRQVKLGRQIGDIREDGEVIDR